MAGLAAETCRWKYHNKNTSVELSAFCEFLIHIVQINARSMGRNNVILSDTFPVCFSMKC